MHFRPSQTTDGRTAIELWDDAGELAATIYAHPKGLHVVCSTNYQPDDLAVDPKLGFVLLSLCAHTQEPL